MGMERGVFGAIFIALSIITVPKLGGAAYIAILVTGQMIAALAVDHFGWLGIKIDLPRLLGVALLIGGVVLIRRSFQRSRGFSSLWPKADTRMVANRQRPLSRWLEITTCNASDPSGHASSCDPNQGQLPRHPSPGPSLAHRYNAAGPNDHAGSVDPIARRSCYRCLRWQPPEAEGSVPLG